MFKNTASQKITVYAFDSTTNLPKTGDSANITSYVSKDDGSLTVLGDTSATEVDSTNGKGYYIFDLTQAETNGDKLLFAAKSSTSNIVVLAMPAVIYTIPANFTKLVIDSSGLADANAVKLGPTGAGTAQTARDIGASVLLSSGSGSGQLDFTSGVVKSNLSQILGTALTETAGLLAGGFKKFFNISTPAATMDHGVLVDTITTYTGNTPQTGDNFVRLGAPAGASIAADLAEIEGETDGIAAIPTSTLSTSHFDTILGSPVTSVSADIAAVKSDTTTINTKTATLSNGGVKKNTPLPAFEFFMAKLSDHVSPQTGLSITSQVSIDGAPFTSTVNAASEVGSGFYSINLAAADLNGTIITLTFSASGADTTGVTLKTEL